MTIHDATEQAYKNGYKAGVNALAKSLLDNVLVYHSGDKHPLRVVNEATIHRMMEEIKDSTL